MSDGYTLADLYLQISVGQQGVALLLVQTVDVSHQTVVVISELLDLLTQPLPFISHLLHALSQLFQLTVFQLLLARPHLLKTSARENTAIEHYIFCVISISLCSSVTVWLNQPDPWQQSRPAGGASAHPAVPSAGGWAPTSRTEWDPILLQCLNTQYTADQNQFIISTWKYLNRQTVRKTDQSGCWRSCWVPSQWSGYTVEDNPVPDSPGKLCNLWLPFAAKCPVGPLQIKGYNKGQRMQDSLRWYIMVLSI